MTHTNDDARDLLKTAWKVREWNRSENLDERTNAQYIKFVGTTTFFDSSDLVFRSAEVTLSYLPARRGAGLYILEVDDKNGGTSAKCAAVEFDYGAKGPIARFFAEREAASVMYDRQFEKRRVQYGF